MPNPQKQNIYLMNDSLFDQLNWEEQLHKALCISIIDEAKRVDLFQKTDNNPPSSIIIWDRDDQEMGKIIVGFRINRQASDIAIKLKEIQADVESYAQKYLL